MADRTGTRTVQIDRTTTQRRRLETRSDQINIAARHGPVSDGAARGVVGTRSRIGRFPEKSIENNISRYVWIGRDQLPDTRSERSIFANRQTGRGGAGGESTSHGHVCECQVDAANRINNRSATADAAHSPVGNQARFGRAGTFW